MEPQRPLELQFLRSKGAVAEVQARLSMEEGG